MDKAPFGVQSKRFQNIGYHPCLDPFARGNPLGPGDYNPKTYDCPYKKYIVGGSCWKRKVDIEEFSKNLGFRNAIILEQRKYWKSKGGPGVYDIVSTGQKSSSCMYNVSFGTDKRFRVSNTSDYPAPSTYATGIRNYIDKSRCKQFTPLPTFEWDGFVDRFKSTEKPWSKPPNLYNPKDFGSFTALLEKVVSKRGPYDVFTGPRDETTIKNHFVPAKFKRTDNFFNKVSDLDLMLRHFKNKNKGRFFQEQRFGLATQRHMIDDPTQVKKNPNDPSPTTYNIEGPVKPIKVNKYAFNQSVVYPRPPTIWTISPGVGRYNPKTSVCSRSKRQSWVFKSTIGRPEYKGPSYNSF